MLKALFAIGVLLGAQPVVAQTATPRSTLAWDQTAPDLATAQSYTYKHYDDGSLTGIALSGVSCVAGASGLWTCSAAFPAFSPGSHTIALSAGNAAGDSAITAPLSFAMVVVPSVPSSLRIGTR